VPVHRGKTLKEGLARGILKDAGITEDEFFDVY
jgi:predicted RNA binding protein YcfA (HicA-like mRNA interferase family)